MKLAEFDFLLPEELIAKRPLKERDSSRLLVLRKDESIEHKKFSDLPLYLDKGDILILNNTKVFPARLTGLKPNGGKIEFLLVRKKDENTWRILSRGKFTGSVKISENLYAEIQNGETACFTHYEDFMESIWHYGKMPLPPYIKRIPDELDKQSYQSVFAKEEGSIAAPTASLHFSNRLLTEIVSKGVKLRELTLHIGVGTFRPIRTETLEKHVMDTECFEMDKTLISEIKSTKISGKKVIAVGTSTTRALEGYMNAQCNVFAQNGKLKGETDIFIFPGYKFKAVDSLVTNFHLPRSTPLLLASALCSREKLMNAYNEAIARGYRFLSYGDAMLIL